MTPGRIHEHPEVVEQSAPVLGHLVVKDRKDTSTEDRSPAPVVFRHPTVADAGRLWRIAGDSQVLDLNPSYAYLLWCRDFARTSLVAELDRAVVGFVSGYRRPDAPEVLMVWQIAVEASAQGRGIAAGLIHALLDAAEECTALETTITDDNEASQQLFRSVARSRGARLRTQPLFSTELFPDGHDAERLYRIEPLT